jgi:uncharacterized protein YndB with AHSA1/START domain
MTIVLTILLVLAGIAALFFILALFINKEYTIKREIVINKPRKVVFDYIKNLKNQEQFNKWVMIDPTMKVDLKGTDGTVGFTYAWDSENKQAGKGEQEIVKIVDGELLDVEVRFERPFKSTAKTPIKTSAVSENQTKVIWGMEGNSKYPMNAMNPFMDNLLGKDLEISLSTLKNILEK